MLSALFVDRPRLAIVIAIVTTIAGALALYSIPIAQYPDIVPPQVSVTASFPGASAAVVDTTIAQPIEAQVVGVDKMIYMKSVSGDDGSYTLTASFELGTDPDINTVNVNNRVQIALASLPEEARRQGVTVKKKSSALLAVIAVYSPKHTHDPLFISNYVTINLLDQIKSTPGVGDATLWGPQDYAMRAWVRTDRLTGLGLTTGDVIDAIRAQNVQAAVGRVGARPISDDQQLQLNVQTQGRLTSVPEFENIVVRTNPDGSVLRLRDIARVELGAANLDRETRLNGGPASAVAIYQTPGANAIATLKAVRDRIGELEKRFPEDLAWKVTYDPTSFVTATIEEVKKTLVEAFVLVVLVVFLFLGSVRATLIPTLAVPVSLIGTFIVLKAVGYSANSVSLLALVLAIGIVVDDAIVVVENVERVMEEHPELSPSEATKRAMQEITAPIIAITLVLLSVFVPVAFIPGISGELFRQFAVTVAVSMFLSAINALTLSPALCGVLLRPHHGPRRGPIGWVMRSIDRVRDAYGGAVARLLRVAIIGLAMVAVASVGIVGLARVAPTGFLPEDDQGALFVVIQTPGAASIARTSEVVRQVEEMLREEEAVADFTSVIGLNFIDNYSQPNAAFMVVTLKSFEERKDRSLGAPALIERLGTKFRQIQGGTVVPMSPPPILGLGTGGGFTYVVQDLRGGDPKALAQALRGLTVAANEDPKLTRVFSTFSDANPSIYLDIDRDKVQVLGVPLSNVFQALQASLGGFYVNDMNLFGRRWQVQVQAEGADRREHRRHLSHQRAQCRGEDDPLAKPGGDPRRGRSARAHSLQQPAGGDRTRRPGGGHLLRAGAQGHGRGCSAYASVRICRRMDRYRVPGEAGRGQDHHDPRVCRAVRVPVSGRTVRKLDHSGAGPAVGVGRHPRIVRRDRPGRADARSLRPDRNDRPDRARGEERHPHRRVRKGTERARRPPARGRDGRRAAALPAGDDDVARLHPRPAAAGGRHGRFGAGAPQCGDASVRRHDRGVRHRYFRHPAALRNVPGHPGKAQAIRAPEASTWRPGVSRCARCRAAAARGGGVAASVEYGGRMLERAPAKC